MVFRGTESRPWHINEMAGSVLPRKSTNYKFRGSWFARGTQPSVARILVTKVSTRSSEKNTGGERVVFCYVADT